MKPHATWLQKRLDNVEARADSELFPTPMIGRLVDAEPGFYSTRRMWLALFSFFQLATEAMYPGHHTGRARITTESRCSKASERSQRCRA